MKNNISIVLPSYKPDEKLEKTVVGFYEAGFDDIIVVDDGGGAEYKAIFDRIKKYEYCTVLTHEVNRGKGAALKTAFEWYVQNRDGIGVITADGDGQHRPEDAVNIAAAMASGEKVVLGVRDFSLPDVPERSKKGNTITSNVFKVLVGMKISDTQTGFRGIPAKYLSQMIGISGDRYEYETNMLLYMKRWDIPFEEVKIQTVYINENETSHFRPVRDSVRIYSLIIKFLLTGLFVKFLGSSLVCFVLDTVLNGGIQLFLRGIAPDAVAVSVSYAVARVCSSLVNFFVNRKIFAGTGSIKKAMVKYYILAVCILLCGSALVTVISGIVCSVPSIRDVFDSMSDNEAETFISAVIKLPVDMVLFVASYTIQKKYVFKKEKVA